jgi:hypothetical protein
MEGIISTQGYAVSRSENYSEQAPGSERGKQCMAGAADLLFSVILFFKVHFDKEK